MSRLTSAATQKEFMDEKSKSIWKKSWRGPGSLLLAWLGLMIATLIIFWVMMLATGTRMTGEELKLWAVFSLGATLVIFFVLFIRWVCCWRIFKRFLFVVTCFATLIALFYAEEDWRGKHDWEKFKREWEAKGEHFDFASVIPPPVPDDENFAFSPVWIAEEKYTFQNTPERAKLGMATGFIARRYQICFRRCQLPCRVWWEQIIGGLLRQLRQKCRAIGRRPAPLI